MMKYEDLRVKHINEGGKGDVLFVTFSPWSARGVPAFFGEHYFSKRGIEAFLIAQNGRNHWWHTKEIYTIASFIRKYADKKCKKIVLYGSSMGAYAACHFRFLFNSIYSIALAPQIFIDNKYHIEQNYIIGNKMALEEKLKLQEDFCFDELDNLNKQKEFELLIGYDPFHPADNSHIKCYKKHVDLTEKVIFLEVPYANHDVARTLNNSGLLSDIILLFNEISIDKVKSLSKTAYLKDPKTFMNYFRKADHSLLNREILNLFESYYQQHSGMDFEALYMMAEALLKLERYEEAINISLESIESYIRLYKYSKRVPSYLHNKFINIVNKALEYNKRD